MPPTSPKVHHIFHYSAGAVVVNAGGCLVIRRDQEWSFPKGHLEQDEDPEDAAVREVMEETGIEIEVDAELGTTTFEFLSETGMRNRKRVDWFLGHGVGGEIRHPSRFAEVKFVPLAEASILLTHDDDRALLERAIEVVQSPTHESLET
jgi:8-oxo-dGTP pyrophosphatase MutT (NUDIX family)